MSVIKEYNGRIFLESEYFKPNDRRIAGLSQNCVWLYTVERGFELDSDTGKRSNRTTDRIVRWRAINDGDSGQKYWRRRSSYNVRSGVEWETTSSLVDSLIEGEVQNDRFIPIKVEEAERLYKDSRKHKSEKRKMLAMISNLKNMDLAREAELTASKKTLSLMRSNVQHLESTLNKYKKLISHINTTETKTHKFLVDNDAFWMFGLEYISIESKVSFPPGKDYYEFDLMLQRHDGFWDLVELKGPNENLFDKRTRRRSKPNQKLSEAIGQVFTYLYAIDRMGEANIIKPKAYIVIGKKETDRPSERRIFSSYLNEVDLITHTDLYERGKQLLKYIKDTHS
jgi:hypothetical protein